MTEGLKQMRNSKVHDIGAQRPALKALFLSFVVKEGRLGCESDYLAAEVIIKELTRQTGYNLIPK